jgi:CheY-like chemotaxis protein
MVQMLVVDDDRMLAETLRAMIQAYSPATAVEIMTSGADAATLLESGAAFDLVICDLIMPGMDGIALYERLRDAGHPAAGRMVFITGGAFTDRAAAFLSRTPVRHLQKPFDLRQLGALIDGSGEPSA